MSDFRLQIGFTRHPKTKRLIRRIGYEGFFRLVDLFAWARVNRPDGDLVGMSDEDIELAVDWSGVPDAFVAALAEVGFVDGEAGERRLHDWSDHNPFSYGADMRSAKARWNAIKRHHGEAEADRQVPEWAGIRGGNRHDDAESAAAGASSNATSMKSDASSSAAAMLRPVCSSAPSPSPSPSPVITTTEARPTHHAPNSARDPVCGQDVNGDPPDSAAAGPPPGAVPTLIRPEVQAAVLLRKRGMRINGHHPGLIAAVAEGVTPAELDAMAEVYPDKPAGYIVEAARRQRAERPQTMRANQRAGPINGLVMPAPSKTRSAIARTLGVSPHAQPAIEHQP